MDVELLRRGFRALFAAGVAVAAAVLVLALLEEEGGRDVTVAVDPGSWGGVRRLLEDTVAVEALQGLDPAGGPGARAAVCVYPTTIGGLAEAGHATVASGAAVLGQFRVEGIANLYMWEHVRTLGLRTDRVYVAASDRRLFEEIDAALRLRFGAEAVRVIRGDVPGNYVLEAAAEAGAVAATPLSLLPRETGELAESLLASILVLSTVEETVRLADLEAAPHLRAIEFRGEAVVTLFDPRVRRLVASLDRPVVLPVGVAAPPGVRAVAAARVPPGEAPERVVDRVYRSRARVVLFRGGAADAAAAVRALREAGYRFGTAAPRPPAGRGLLALLLLALWPAFLAVVAGLAGIRTGPVYAAALAAVAAVHLLVGPGAALAALAAVVAGAGGAWGLLRWEEAGPGSGPPLTEAATVLALTGAAALGAAALATLVPPGAPWPEGRVLVLAAAVYVAAQFAVGVPPSRPARAGLLLAALAAWTAAPAAGALVERLAETSAGIGAWGLTPRRALALAGGAALYLRVAHLAERRRLLLSLLAVVGQTAVLLEVADPARPVLRRLVGAAAVGLAGPLLGAAGHLAARWRLEERTAEDEEEGER